MGGRRRWRETSTCGCFSHAPKWGTWPATQACAPTENRISDLLVHRPALNPMSHTSQGYLPLICDGTLIVSDKAGKYFKLYFRGLFALPKL